MDTIAKTEQAARFTNLESEKPATEMERIAAEGQEEEWADLLEGAPVATPAEFHVDNEEKAAWLVRKVNQARERAEKAKEWAAREFERAEAEEARLMARFGAELERFARARLAGGKKRSFSLPSGTVGFRKAPARLAVDDDAAALEWAKQNAPAAVVIVPAVEKLSKPDLSIAFKATGEIPSGCHVEDEHDSFSVK